MGMEDIGPVSFVQRFKVQKFNVRIQRFDGQKPAASKLYDRRPDEATDSQSPAGCFALVKHFA